MRKLAIEILLKLDENNFNSTNLLNKYSKNISEIDSKFLRELVYGTLENRIYIDYIIRKLCKLRIKKFDKYVLNILRISIYQILFMDKVPEFAIINEAVNLTKKYKLKRFSGFVNGSLRNFLRNKEEFSKIEVDDITDLLSIKYSTNKDIIKILIEDYGVKIAEEIIKSSINRPHFAIRICSFEKDEQQVVDEISKFGYKLAKSSIAKSAYFVENPTNLLNSENFKNGDFTVQDVGSILASEILNPSKDSYVLDICAAPGGKTAHISYIMDNTGKIIANDIIENKLKKIRENCDRLKISNVETSNFDATILQEDLIGKFDYILCDVICSGIGVMDRKPEIKLFRTKEDIETLVELQRSIFSNAVKYLKPNGKIVYSTCSVLKMENEENINYFKENENVDLLKIKFLGKDQDYIKLLPEKEKHNGFFIAKFIKRS